MMKTDDIVTDCSDHAALLFEIVPPVEGNQKKRLRSHQKYISRLLRETDVNALNLPEIQNESKKGEKGKRRNPYKKRVSPRKYTRSLSAAFNTKYIINHVCVKHDPPKLEQWLLETHNQFDISQIILVGGESSSERYDGLSVCEGNKLVKNYLNNGKRKYQNETIDPTNFTLGNICIPTRRRPDYDEPERMLDKFDAGADFFTSQIITEAETPISLLKDFSSLLEQNQIENPPAIFWSFTPISSKKDVDFLRWLGVYIPERTEKYILGSENPASVSLETTQRVCEKLLDFNHQLPVPLPMGFNISVMGLRNFENGIQLAKHLEMEGVES